MPQKLNTFNAAVPIATDTRKRAAAPGFIRGNESADAQSASSISSVLVTCHCVGSTDHVLHGSTVSQGSK
jgi:hypothetical protein